jgi:hypothetical protein
MAEENRIAELEAEIDALKARLPRHSVPPAMMLELENLEDEIEALRAAAREPAATGPLRVESVGRRPTPAPVPTAFEDTDNP